jgi:hypothetical protein
MIMAESESFTGGLFSEEEPEANAFDALRVKVMAAGRVSAEDVLTLRRTIFPDGVVDRGEIDAVFQLAELAPGGDPAWPSFFFELVADHFLNQQEPVGYLAHEDVCHLKALITRDGHLASQLELAALIHLVEKAVETPRALCEFIALQIRARIAARETLHIDNADVSLIHRFLHASGADDSIGISRQEADFLFDLHDMTAGAENDHAWPELFVKAIAAHLTQHVGYKPLPREEALRLQRWADDTKASPGRFFQAMTGGGLKAILEAYLAPDAWQERNETFEAEATIARQVTDDEAAWLVERMGRNRYLDDVERLVLIYLRDHLDVDLPAPLAELILDEPQANAAE